LISFEKELDISNNSFDRIQDFPAVKTLIWFKAMHCGIFSINTIGEKFPNLTFLDLRNNELLTEIDLGHLIELKELADLSISGNPLSTKCKYFYKIANKLVFWNGQKRICH